MAKIIIQEQNFVGLYEAIRRRQIAQKAAQNFQAQTRRPGVSSLITGPAGFINLTGNTIVNPQSLIIPSRNVPAGTIAGIRNINYATSNVIANTKIYNPQISEYLKPVSSFVGLTLGTLTGILADATGSISILSRSLASLIERVFPGFAANIEATFKKYKIEGLAHLPGQILGGIRNLITLVDAAISLPFIILADLYQELMKFMDEIAKIIDEAMSLVQQFLFGPGGLLDGLYIDEILAILEEVSVIAGELGALAGIFSASNPITSITNMVQNYAGQLSSFIQNPLDTLFAYAPPQVSQALYLIRNPQQMINSILPPQLSQMFKQVSAVTGFGFNGNMGYGFASVLQGLRGGVLNAIFSNFSTQFPLLTQLVGGLGGGASSGAPGLLTNPYGQQTSAGGVVQPQTVPKPVLPNKPSTQSKPSASGRGIGVPNSPSATGRLPSGQTAQRTPDGRVEVKVPGGSYIISENYFKTLYPNEKVP